MMKQRKKDKKQGAVISRKAAIKKLGYISLSGATMMFLLNNPAKAADNYSPELPPEWYY